MQKPTTASSCSICCEEESTESTSNNNCQSKQTNQNPNSNICSQTDFFFFFSCLSFFFFFLLTCIAIISLLVEKGFQESNLVCLGNIAIRKANNWFTFCPRHLEVSCHSTSVTTRESYFFLVNSI